MAVAGNKKVVRVAVALSARAVGVDSVLLAVIDVRADDRKVLLVVKSRGSESAGLADGPRRFDQAPSAASRVFDRRWRQRPGEGDCGGVDAVFGFCPASLANVVIADFVGLQAT
jgi:hypothetical protein